MNPFPVHDIVHIAGVDYPESIGIGPDGEAYTSGTGRQVYRLNLHDNTATIFAHTRARCLGSVVDADHNLYLGQSRGGDVLKVTPDGQVTTYAVGPGGKPFQCANYPAFDAQGRMYLSDSGNWSGEINGHIYRINPGGGTAELWFSEPVNTPNAIALDAEERYLYFVETFGHAISRIAINKDGTAGACERVVHMPKHVPDGIAFDDKGRLWIACHRPDAICMFNLDTRRIETFAEDWKGKQLRGPTDVAFAGTDREIILAASLDNLVVHRFDNVGVRGLKLNYPRIA